MALVRIYANRLDRLKVTSKRGELFRTEAMMTAALFPTGDSRKNQLSKRSKLLMMRQIKPHLFHLPIPITDEEIRKSRVYCVSFGGHFVTPTLEH